MDFSLICNALVGVGATVVLVIVVAKLIAPTVETYRRNKTLSKLVGENKSHWLWGDAVKYNFSTFEGLLNSVQRCKQFPAMCSQWQGPFYMQVHVYHPDVVKTVFSKSIPKGALYTFIKPLLKEGLVTSAGEVWKRHRRLLTPIFHFELLKSHLEVFNKNCCLLLDQCENYSASGAVMDVARILSDMSFSNMMECVMSQTAEDNQSGNVSIIQSMKDASFNIFQRMNNPILWNDRIYKLTTNGQSFYKCCKRVHDRCLQIIAERRVVIESLSIQDEISESAFIQDKKTGKNFSFRKRKGKLVDFLDILLQTKDQDGNGLSDEEIMDEVVTFFIAGQETVATGLSYTFYNLANNPEHQKKCREEITCVLGEKENVEIHDTNQLIYLTKCIKESLRLTPVVHLVSRELMEEVTFTHRFNGYKEIKVPAGTEVDVNIYALHRNPHVWENPDTFDPDNFDIENSAKRSSFAFVPFAAGQRNCIGQHFAMHQMRVVLCQVLRKYELFRDMDTEEPIFKPGITVQSTNGILLKARSLQ